MCLLACSVIMSLFDTQKCIFAVRIKANTQSSSLSETKGRLCKRYSRNLLSKLNKTQ